jgi:hypothetical protein
MALPFALVDESTESARAGDTDRVASGLLPRSGRDPRALRILAKSIYRELRGGGLAEEDVMAIAGDLLGHVASEVKDRRRHASERPPSR